MDFVKNARSAWTVFIITEQLCSRFELVNLFGFLNNHQSNQLVWLFVCNKQICRAIRLPPFLAPDATDGKWKWSLTQFSELSKLIWIARANTILCITVAWISTAVKVLHCNLFKVQLMALSRMTFPYVWVVSSPPVPYCVHTGWPMGPWTISSKWQKAHPTPSLYVFCVCPPLLCSQTCPESVSRLFKDN